MVKLKSVRQIQGIYNGNYTDFDQYTIEIHSSFSTKEVSIIVDFLNEEITGDCIAHGNWFDLEKEACLEILNLMLLNNQSKRDFSHID